MYECPGDARFPRVAVIPAEWALLQILESESDVADAAQGQEEGDTGSGGSGFSDFVGRAQKKNYPSSRRLVVRVRGSRWVCSRAEQRASPPVLYSASGGYRRTAKAPIACDFSCGLERKVGLPWSECSGADDER